MTARVGLVAAAMLAIALPAGTAAGAPARASFTDVESELMCLSCHEPLAVANAPEAQAERDEIRRLIARGETKAQIERDMVAQYGPAVLGKPPASGFNLAVYVVPPALLVAGIALLAFTLPRWRRRTRTRAGGIVQAGSPAALDPGDARRLDEDLARYGA